MVMVRSAADPLLLRSAADPLLVVVLLVPVVVGGTVVVDSSVLPVVVVVVAGSVYASPGSVLLPAAVGPDNDVMVVMVRTGTDPLLPASVAYDN